MAQAAATPRVVAVGRRYIKGCSSTTSCRRCPATSPRVTATPLAFCAHTPPATVTVSSPKSFSQTTYSWQTRSAGTRPLGSRTGGGWRHSRRRLPSWTMALSNVLLGRHTPKSKQPRSKTPKLPSTLTPCRTLYNGGPTVFPPSPLALPSDSSQGSHVLSSEGAG